MFSTVFNWRPCQCVCVCLVGNRFELITNSSSENVFYLPIFDQQEGQMLLFELMLFPKVLLCRNGAPATFNGTLLKATKQGQETGEGVSFD